MKRSARIPPSQWVPADVPDSQIDVISFGKEKPLRMEMTDERRQRHRRAHFQAQ